MRDADWLDAPDDQGDDQRRSRSRPLLVGLASIPWLLVAALLLVPGRGGPPAAPAGAPASDRAEATVDDLDGRPHDDADGDPIGGPDGGTHRPTEPTERPSGAEPMSPPPTSSEEQAGAAASDLPSVPMLRQSDSETVTPLYAQEIRGQWRVEAGAEEASALAVVAARAWLTGAEPTLRLGGLTPPRTDGYVEHIVVEAVEQPARDAAVVTLVAVVLDTESPDLSPSVRRLAVPVLLTDEGPRLTAPPWELPPPTLELLELPRQRIGDEDERLAAVAALDAAGFGDHELADLHVTSGWPVVAELMPPTGEGSSDSSESRESREVWLRRHLDGFVVAGTTLADARHLDSVAGVDPDAVREPGGRP